MNTPPTLSYSPLLTSFPKIYKTWGPSLETSKAHAYFDFISSHPKSAKICECDPAYSLFAGNFNF